MIDRYDVQSGKRLLENDENVQCMVQKLFDDSSWVVLSIGNSSASADEQARNQHYARDKSDLNNDQTTFAHFVEYFHHFSMVFFHYGLQSYQSFSCIILIWACFYGIGHDNSISSLILYSRSDFGM